MARLLRQIKSAYHQMRGVEYAIGIRHEIRRHQPRNFKMRRAAASFRSRRRHVTFTRALRHW